MLAGEDYGIEAIRRLAPFLFNVYVQNHRLDPKGTVLISTWKQGKVVAEHIGLWKEGGVDFEEVFLGLDEITYVGFVTVHQEFAGAMPVEEAVRKSVEFLKTFG